MSLAGVWKSAWASHHTKPGSMPRDCSPATTPRDALQLPDSRTGNAPEESASAVAALMARCNANPVRSSLRH
jgi:hypothetical protein